MRWVIAYDVSDDGVRRRVDHRLRAVGWRVQRSVFLSRATRQRIERALEDLRPLLDPCTDTVLALPVDGSGRGPLFAGVAPDIAHDEPVVI